MVSGLAEGALVSPHRIITSDETNWWRSIGQGWVVKVEEEDTYATCKTEERSYHMTFTRGSTLDMSSLQMIP